MAQQHMDFNPPRNADEQPASYTSGYQQEQGPYLDEYATPSQGQKLSQQAGNTGPTSAQRLALAIVSLSLFAFVFMMAVIMAIVVPPDTYKQLGPVLGGFGFMFVLVLIAVNGFFSPHHKR